MRHLSLLPVVGHGSTDLFDLPFNTILTHFICFNLVKNLNINQRKNLLIGSSIIHLSNDFFFTKHFKLIVSGIFHFFAIKKPIIFKLYMNLLHTPLHYFKTFKFNNNNNIPDINNINNLIKKSKVAIVLITTLISAISIKNNLDVKLEEKFGEYWWVSPVLAHIIINEIINYEIKLKNQETTFNKLKFNRILII